jgi:hypothetical protein
MALHLIKLCVGVSTIDELVEYVKSDIAEQRRRGLKPEDSHTTRMFPQRAAELLDGGSLYWVIRGKVQARQPLIAIHPVTGTDGIQRCKLVFEPKVIATEWQPRRAFQGWRYLSAEDAPRDLSDASKRALPAQLRIELAELGLL